MTAAHTTNGVTGAASIFQFSPKFYFKSSKKMSSVEIVFAPFTLKIKQVSSSRLKCSKMRLFFQIGTIKYLSHCCSGFK